MFPQFDNLAYVIALSHTLAHALTCALNGNHFTVDLELDLLEEALTGVLGITNKVRDGGDTGSEEVTLEIDVVLHVLGVNTSGRVLGGRGARGRGGSLILSTNVGTELRAETSGGRGLSEGDVDNHVIEEITKLRLDLPICGGLTTTNSHALKSIYFSSCDTLSRGTDYILSISFSLTPITI